jgi:hypothetical protein
MITPNGPFDFPSHLRETYESSRYRSIRRLAQAIRAVYGEDAISESTIKRLLSPQGYRPRNRRPYYQLKHILPALKLPDGV